MQMKTSFMILEILLFGFGKVLEIFKEVCTNSDKILIRVMRISRKIKEN